MAGIQHTADAGAPWRHLAPLTTFVGREGEIDHVSALLLREGIRLLTITGSGGIGKTRLALQVVDRVRDRFEDGAAIVPLAMIRDQAQMPAEIVRVLEVPDVPGQPVTSRLQAFFADRQMLVLLDNMEHLPDAALLVAELLAACPRLTILATSRTRINASGEHLYPLDSLDEDEARELFALRGRAVWPLFEVTVDTEDVIDAICARLDRLPLAIELAAARIAELPPRALLARLDSRLELLSGGPGDAPDRHRDMRGAIAWSHDLLSADEQAVFRRLGVFIGGFTFESAAAVAGLGTDVLVEVTALLRANLVRPIDGVNDEPRFTMLETVREYALEMLAANGEEMETRRRHAEFFQRMAEDALPHYDGPDLGLYNARVDRELDNCRAAMTWCLETGAMETGVRLAGALWRVWWYALAAGKKPWWDRREEGREWCMRMLAAADELPVEAVTEASIGAAFLGRWVIDYPEVIRLGEDLLARARAEDYPYGQWWALHLIGTTLFEEDQVDAALPYLEESRDIAPRVRNPENHLSMSLCWLGEVAERAGDLEEAATLYGEALAQCRISRNPGITSQATYHLGVVCRMQGRLHEALPYFLEAANIFARHHDSGGQQAVLIEVACVAEMEMDLDVAARLLGAADSLDGHEGYRETFEETTSRIRSKLGQEAFESAWQAGKASTWEDVVALMESLSLKLDAREPPPSAQRESPHGLTPRELQVLVLLADGKSNRAIAESLSLSERTVENHVLHLLTKLGLESRTAAATFAVRHGIA